MRPLRAACSKNSNVSAPRSQTSTTLAFSGKPSVPLIHSCGRYRLKRDGDLPTSLADVTAELSGSVPEDPFNGQPLRYRKLPAGGCTVYSVGRDRKDDGSTVQGPDVKKPRDVAMTIARQETADAINANDCVL